MTPSVTNSAILTAVRAFLLNVLPSGVEVFKGQANLVPEPINPDYVVMTPLYRKRLATDLQAWDGTASQTFTEPLQMTIQLDIHGEQGNDNAQVIALLWRSQYAVEFMATNGYAIRPLYADDGNQVPFINGENQYEDRWTFNIHLQANPAVSTPQQFADTLTAGLIEVDAEYPPGA